MHIFNISKVRMTVKGQDGEWLTINGPVEDLFSVGDQTAFMPKMVLTLKADGDGLNRMLDIARGPSTFPITVTVFSKRPKKRRHARGGLRRLIAARAHKFTAHGVSMKGDNTGAPWTFTMPVTRGTR